MSLSTVELNVSRGKSRILSGITISVQPGRVVGLLGANGAGKSTLLAALAGEIPIDGGSIHMDDTPLSAIPVGMRARQRAVLPQHGALSFDLGVDEVVAMGAYPFPELSPAQVTELVRTSLGLAGIGHLALRRYPDLSGGEQQRVQFARVLVQCLAPQNPVGSRYLLLDEPTASLDPKHQIALLRTTADLARRNRVGVMAAMHDINLAAHWCDELVLLGGGGVIACGPPATVLTSENLRRVYDIDADVLAHPTQPNRLLVLHR